MRLWSLHPSYLDRQGLVALWREGLLAKAVLEGKTKGYHSHPQLIRFRQHPTPVRAIQAYLYAVYEESLKRQYSFDASKIMNPGRVKPLTVTDGQLLFEWRHLMKKLKRRSPDFFHKLKNIPFPEPHPLMIVINGEIEPWERAVESLKGTKG